MARTRSESIKRYIFGSNRIVHSLIDVFGQLETICTVQPGSRDVKYANKFKRLSLAQRREIRRQLRDDLRASVELLDSRRN